MATQEQRKEDENDFLNFCKEGHLNSVKTLLNKDPSLINSKDWYGKLFYLYLLDNISKDVQYDKKRL